MLIYEVIIETLRLVGREDIAEELEAHYAQNTALSAEGARLKRTFLTYLNAVGQELGSYYFPCQATSRIDKAVNKFAYGFYAHWPVHILKATLPDTGESVPFTMADCCIEADISGNSLDVTYQYCSWQEKGETDNFKCSRPEIGVLMVEYGMAAEYFLMLGEVSTAAAWEKKFRDLVDAAIRPEPKFRGKVKDAGRRWV